jgi:hypothetical protein
MNIITINSQIKWNVFLNLKTNLIKKKVESLFKIIFVFIVNENRKNYVSLIRLVFYMIDV